MNKSKVNGPIINLESQFYILPLIKSQINQLYASCGTHQTHPHNTNMGHHIYISYMPSAICLSLELFHFFSH